MPRPRRRPTWQVRPWLALRRGTPQAPRPLIPDRPLESQAALLLVLPTTWWMMKATAEEVRGGCSSPLADHEGGNRRGRRHSDRGANLRRGSAVVAHRSPADPIGPSRPTTGAWWALVTGSPETLCGRCHGRRGVRGERCFSRVEWAHAAFRDVDEVAARGGDLEECAR